jgi:hypothetical protein
MRDRNLAGKAILVCGATSGMARRAPGMISVNAQWTGGVMPPGDAP